MMCRVVLYLSISAARKIEIMGSYYWWRHREEKKEPGNWEVEKHTLNPRLLMQHAKKSFSPAQVEKGRVTLYGNLLGLDKNRAAGTRTTPTIRNTDTRQGWQTAGWLQAVAPKRKHLFVFFHLVNGSEGCRLYVCNESHHFLFTYRRNGKIDDILIMNSRKIRATMILWAKYAFNTVYEVFGLLQPKMSLVLGTACRRSSRRHSHWT